MIYYIAGKITGDPDYEAKFNVAKDVIEKFGQTVLNPASLPEGMENADYARICFAMIDTADAVVFLPGFSESAGAMLEYSYCEYTGKKIIDWR